RHLSATPPCPTRRSSDLACDPGETDPNYWPFTSATGAYAISRTSDYWRYLICDTRTATAQLTSMFTCGTFEFLSSSNRAVGRILLSGAVLGNTSLIGVNYAHFLVGFMSKYIA